MGLIAKLDHVARTRDPRKIIDEINRVKELEKVNPRRSIPRTESERKQRSAQLAARLYKAYLQSKYNKINKLSDKDQLNVSEISTVGINTEETMAKKIKQPMLVAPSTVSSRAQKDQKITEAVVPEPVASRNPTRPRRPLLRLLLANTKPVVRSTTILSTDTVVRDSNYPEGVVTRLNVGISTQETRERKREEETKRDLGGRAIPGLRTTETESLGFASDAGLIQSDKLQDQTCEINAHEEVYNSNTEVGNPSREDSGNQTNTKSLLRLSDSHSGGSSRQRKPMRELPSQNGDVASVSPDGLERDQPKCRSCGSVCGPARSKQCADPRELEQNRPVSSPSCNPEDSENSNLASAHQAGGHSGVSGNSSRRSVGSRSRIPARPATDSPREVESGSFCRELSENSGLGHRDEDQFLHRGDQVSDGDDSQLEIQTPRVRQARSASRSMGSGLPASPETEVAYTRKPQTRKPGVLELVRAKAQQVVRGEVIIEHDQLAEKVRGLAYAYEAALGAYLHKPTLKVFKNGVSPAHRGYEGLKRAALLADQAGVSYETYVQAQFYWFDKWFRRAPRIYELSGLKGSFPAPERLRKYMLLMNRGSVPTKLIVGYAQRCKVDLQELDKINAAKLTQLMNAWGLSETEVLLKFARPGIEYFDLQWLKRHPTYQKLKQQNLL
jgi:hypothetical protein